MHHLALFSTMQMLLIGTIPNWSSLSQLTRAHNRPVLNSLKPRSKASYNNQLFPDSS